MNTEATRLQADYIDRLGRALADRNRGDVAEIVQSVQEHIDDALVEYGDGEVTLVQMAQVLERVGSPESYAREDEATRPPRPAPAPPPPLPSAEPAARRPESPPPPSYEERETFAAMLDKVWWAYLVSIIGLYVPLIDVYVCDIIGYGILAYVLASYAGPGCHALGGAGKFALVTTVLLLITAPIATASFFAPIVGGLGILVALSVLVVSLVVYWKVFGGTAAFMRRNGYSHIAHSILTARAIYVFLTTGAFILAIAVGVVIVTNMRIKHGAQLWWVEYAMLPISWLTGWLLVLRPISKARNALRSGGC